MQEVLLLISLAVPDLFRCPPVAVPAVGCAYIEWTPLPFLAGHHHRTAVSARHSKVIIFYAKQKETGWTMRIRNSFQCRSKSIAATGLDASLAAKGLLNNPVTQ